MRFFVEAFSSVFTAREHYSVDFVIVHYADLKVSVGWRN